MKLNVLPALSIAFPGNLFVVASPNELYPDDDIQNNSKFNAAYIPVSIPHPEESNRKPAGKKKRRNIFSRRPKGRPIGMGDDRKIGKSDTNNFVQGETRSEIYSSTPASRRGYSYREPNQGKTGLQQSIKKNQAMEERFMKNKEDSKRKNEQKQLDHERSKPENGNFLRQEKSRMENQQQQDIPDDQMEMLNQLLQDSTLRNFDSDEAVRESQMATNDESSQNTNLDESSNEEDGESISNSDEATG